MNPGSKVKTKPEKQLECKVRLAMMEWQIDWLRFLSEQNRHE